MGLRTMTATLECGTTRGVLYCSTGMVCLPWIFSSAEDADAFVAKCGDIRMLSHAEQEKLFETWQATKVDGS